LQRHEGSGRAAVLVFYLIQRCVQDSSWRLIQQRAVDHPCRRPAARAKQQTVTCPNCSTSLRRGGGLVDAPGRGGSDPTSGHTVASYAADVFLPYNQAPRVRKAQARDYRRHLRIVVERLGDVPLARLEPRDIRGLQAELLDRGLSPKYVKNILSGSLRALIAQALDDKALPADPFPRRLKWPKWRPPGADPFTADERMAILRWFEQKRFGLRPGPDFTQTSPVRHPSYHAFVHTLFWTGLRPSEAAGLQWQDLDLARARLHVQRSRHLYEDGAPKTAAAERWVELFPETVRVLGALQPLRATPTHPVFTTTEGQPIEPKAFASRYWYRCARWDSASGVSTRRRTPSSRRLSRWA
jgi:integrase